MDSSVLEPLDWDEQEAATTPSLARPESSIRRSSKGWLVITNEWPRESQRDTVVDAPATERSHPPTRAASEPAPSTMRPAGDAFDAAHEERSIGSAPDSVLPPSARHSDVRALSAPLPLLRDVGSEVETRRRFSSLDLSPITEPLEQQIRQLRRWLMVSLGLSAVATVAAAIAVIYALGGPPAPRFELPSVSKGSATMANLPPRHAAPVVATAHAVLTTPSVPRASSEAAAPTAISSDGRVGLEVNLVAPHANVTLTQYGTDPRSLFGPWPQTLRLDPGHYTVTAYRPGFTLFQKQLDLELSHPEESVTITFD